MIPSSHIKLIEIAERECPALAPLFEFNGPLTLESKPPQQIFEFLARTVTGQQLSTKAAGTIWGRVKQLADTQKQSLETLFTSADQTVLRGTGLSRNKVRALKELAQAIDQGRLDGHALQQSEYAEVRNAITQFWGLGDWTAAICAMAFCGLPDVYPEGDVTIQQSLLKIEPDLEPEILAKKFSPYRSLLCYHLWRGMDLGFGGFHVTKA